MFLEVGANDGIRQSNTYIFEKFADWTGILIEPSSYYNQLNVNRPNSIHFNCALVSYDWNKSTIIGDFGNPNSNAKNLMSTTEQSNMFKGGKTEVLAKKIDDVISSTKFVEFDLISLDTEGSELSVLKGFNFNKHKTKYFLIEISDSPEHMKANNIKDDNNRNNIYSLLEKNGYELIEDFKSGDYLFKNKNFINE